jgi:hypothetical protein
MMLISIKSQQINSLAIGGEEGGVQNTLVELGFPRRASSSLLARRVLFCQ